MFVNPTPQVTFTFSQNPVCNNINPVVTLNSSTPGGTYSGQGVTGSTFNASGLSAGTYSVTYSFTDLAGCTGSDTSTIVVSTCDGIANVAADGIEIYPNPFSNTITINMQGNYGDGIAQLTDITGREISRMHFDAGVMTVQMNTNSLANGVYLLNLIVDGKLVAVKKLFREE